MTIEIIVYFTFVARLELATANYMELQQYLRTHTQPPEVTEASLPQRQQNVRLGSMALLGPHPSMAAQRLQPAVRSPVRMRGGGEDGNDGHRGNGDRVDGGDGAGDDGVGDGAGDDGVGDGDVDSDGDGDGSLLRHGRRQRTVSADECKRLKRMRAAAALKASRAAQKRAREEAADVLARGFASPAE